jgi:hypothetical protein
MVRGASVRRLRSRSLVRAGGGEVGGGGGWWEGKRQDGVTNRRRIFIKFFLSRKKFALRRWPITAHNEINVPAQLRRSNGPQPQYRISYWRQGYMFHFKYTSKIRKKHNPMYPLNIFPFLRENRSLHVIISELRLRETLYGKLWPDKMAELQPPFLPSDKSMTNLLSNAECGPSNALASFSKHSQQDRTLQQDRWSPGNVRQQVANPSSAF